MRKRAGRRISGRGQLAAQSQSRVIDPKLQCARKDKVARDALSRLTRFKRNKIPRARYLMCLTISDATAKMYLAAVVKFEMWSHRLHLSLHHLNTVDIAMTRFFTELFFDGDSPAEGRNCLYGFLFWRTDEDGNRNNRLPRATRALRGWTKRTAHLTVDPVPLCVICLLAQYFANIKLPRLAMFCLVGFDTYLRPSELLSLTRSQVHVPTRRAGPQFSKTWTLCIAPATGDFRTTTNLSDVSIVLGNKRPWNLELFAPFFRKSSREHLFPFDLEFAERKFAQGIKALGLPLRLTPHVLRHSGPSCDRFEELRSLEDIRRRGQWAALSSVQRYERHASLLRSLHRLSNEQQALARDAEPHTVTTLKPLLTSRHLQ